MKKRTAFVTGAAQGIGLGIARALAERGARVVLADLNVEQAEEAAGELAANGSDAIAVFLDVTDRASVDEAVADATERFGAPGIVVNNVGFDDLMPFVETTEELWDRLLDINFKGALRVTQATVPGMVEEGWGRVINIGSDAGRVGSTLESVYSGTKGGLIAFTKTLAREVARSGVTANSVCPGPTDTPALREVADSMGDDADAVIGAMVKAVPMRRAAQPSDIGAAVAFFASEEAGYITGQTLSVSGGLTMA